MPGIKRLCLLSRLGVLWLGFFLASCTALEKQSRPLNSEIQNSQSLSSFLSTCRPALGKPSPEFIYHPYFKQLKANRFFLSFRDELSDYSQWRDWVGQLLLTGHRNSDESISFACREALLSAEVFHKRAQLFKGWQQDLYRPWPIVADLMKPIVNMGVQRELQEQQTVEKHYRAVAHPLDMGMLADRQWYGSRQYKTEPFNFDDVTFDALGIPKLSRQQEEDLLDHWQPLWAIQEKANNDRPLTLQRREGELQMKTEPSIYRYLSFARLGDDVVWQLNYVIWFRERKADGPLDILAGKLDGIHFRSYLDRQGKLLAHDAMHNCGCWYQLYASPRLRQLETPGGEPSYHSQFWPGNKTPIILISANHHRVEAVLPYRDSPWRRHGSAVQPLQKKGYEKLRNVFLPSGLIPESKRPERFLFAPLGVTAAGSMRSRGRHQIAFTSERYFDDPRLLESLGYQRINP